MKTAFQYEEEWLELVTIRLGDRNAPLNPVGTFRNRHGTLVKRILPVDDPAAESLRK